MASGEKLGMTPENVEAYAHALSGYSDTLESIASDVAKAGWASRSPSLFDLIPGSSLVMTAGSIVLAESAAADVRAAVASAHELLGRLTGEVAAQRFASSAEDGSYVLGFMSAADAQAMYERIIKDPGELEGMTAAQTATFWKYLSVEQSDELWQTYPTLVGNKSGVPLIVRIEANKLNAENALADADFSTPAQESYLKLVAEGTVQLVTYDPENYRIVEAINYATWDEEQGRYVPRDTPPGTVFTYVPGTSSDMETFYKGENYQAFVKALMLGREDSVAFVYKDGLFPGERPGSDPLGEAKDQSFALNSGQTLFEFQQDLGRDSSLTDARQVAIGHSWGLANVTASEVAGAHYDEVISLAGAWMPDGWEPDPSTEYSHYSYADWLEAAHKADPLIPFVEIGSGDFPSENPAFDKHFYSSKYDDQLIPEISLDPNETARELQEAKDAWLANHELVHQNGTENAAVIEDVKEDVYG